VLFLFQPVIKEKGFSFTLEALISFIVLIAIISIPVQENENNMEKIYTIQKENDLIKIWIKTEEFSEKGMKEDFRKMFPFQKGEVFIDGKKIEIEGTKGENELKNSGFYYSQGKLKEISVKVFI
jgi:hypothetical protein